MSYIDKIKAEPQELERYRFLLSNMKNHVKEYQLAVFGTPIQEFFRFWLYEATTSDAERVKRLNYLDYFIEHLDIDPKIEIQEFICFKDTSMFGNSKRFKKDKKFPEATKYYSSLTKFLKCCWSQRV